MLSSLCYLYSLYYYEIKEVPHLESNDHEMITEV